MPSRLLLELMDQNDRLLTAGLDELRGRGIILSTTPRGDPTYRFAHQRIRELVYDRLSYSQRQPLHLQAAELLSQGSSPRRGRLPPDRPPLSAGRQPPACSGVPHPGL